MTIDRRGDTVIYTSEDGRQIPAQLVVAVGPDGQPTGSVQITARDVKMKDGVSLAGSWEALAEDDGRMGLTIRNDSGAQGPAGSVGPAGAKGDAGAQGATGAQGVKGDTGQSGATLVGQVVIGQTALVAIALGIREVTATLAGAVVGERYMAFARSYKLNGGASVAGRPPSYTVLDCACNTAGQITVSLNAPLLAIGASYAITTDIVKVNAS